MNLVIIAKSIKIFKGLITMYRIGQGFDIHQLMSKQDYKHQNNADRELILGGVVILGSQYVAVGHSDADCLLHAIVDALLGAAALGDIGQHFPDHDPKYKNIASSKLLEATYKKISSLGYQIVNIDSTIVLEKPKLANFIEEIRINIASVLGIKNDIVNVKAKTNEKLDSIGSYEAISAQAVVLLCKNS